MTGHKFKWVGPPWALGWEVCEACKIVRFMASNWGSSDIRVLSPFTDKPIPCEKGVPS